MDEIKLFHNDLKGENLLITKDDVANFVDYGVGQSFSLFASRIIKKNINFQNLRFLLMPLILKLEVYLIILQTSIKKTEMLIKYVIPLKIPF